jgi:hypothetical protein
MAAVISDPVGVLYHARVLLRSLAAVAAAAVQGAESYGYGHPHYHTQTSSSYDPWTTTSTSSSTTGWYSPYQQYSPPKIAYKGGSSKVTEFAICQVIPSP